MFTRQKVIAGFGNCIIEKYVINEYGNGSSKTEIRTNQRQRVCLRIQLVILPRDINCVIVMEKQFFADLSDYTC